MNANLEAIKQEIIAGADELSSSKEVYEFKKKFLDGKTGKIGLLMREMKNIPFAPAPAPCAQGSSKAIFPKHRAKRLCASSSVVLQAVMQADISIRDAPMPTN